MINRLALVAASTLAALATLPSAAAANHVWQYNGRPLHWASTTNPAQIDLGENLDDSVWFSQRHVPGMVWSATRSGGRLVASSFLRVYSRTGGSASNEVEVYDGFYGRTGWIGQATLNSVDSQGHIRDATIQLNQSYALSRAEKEATINHEVGHALGLDHQNGTVMCAALCGISRPTQHDYDVVNFVNAHRDTYNSTAPQALRAPVQPGDTARRRSGPRGIVYVTRLADRTIRVRFRDFVSEAATDAALMR